MSADAVINIFPWTILLTLGFAAFYAWQRERRLDREMRYREIEVRAIKDREDEERRAKELDAERFQQYLREKKAEEGRIRAQAGVGTGGYIVVDLPDDQRGLFQDLLKGFEEYARLKGYGVAFSVDNTFQERIAFKFTLTDPDVVVAGDRVRKDLKEYLERVTSGDTLDDIPQVVSIDEHELLVATLRNRISFLQHNYNLAKNSIEFYERLMQRVGAQAFLPSPSVVVQTGGANHSSSYSALNSPQAVLGFENSVQNSIRIGVTFRERKSQIDDLARLLELLGREPARPARDEAIRNLENVREELEHVDSPDTGRVSRWMQRAKEALQLGGLGYETLHAAQELFKAFGLT